MFRELPAGTLTSSPRLLGARWRWWLAAALLTIATVVIVPEIHWSGFADAIAAARSRPLVVPGAVVLYALAFVLRAFAWRLLLVSRARFRDLISIVHASLFLNHVLPFKAGELARPLLAERHGLPGREALASTAVARALDFATVIVIALLAIPLARAAGGLTIALVAAAGLVTAASTGLLALRGVRGNTEPTLLRRFAAVAEGLQSIPARRIALAIPLIVLSWVFEAGMVWAAAELLGHSLTLRMAVGATAATIACQAVHLTPGGLGLYEAAMTAALASFGVPPEDALAIAILSHGLKYAYALIAGGGFTLGEAVFVLRGAPAGEAKRASTVEVVAARLWNVLNEGKPFTPVFTAFVLFVVWGPRLLLHGGWTGSAVAAASIVPLALVFWRFPFPLRLRTALWAYLALFIVLTGMVPITATVLVLGLYFLFTVVAWGTVYYHLRIGTAWTNGFRFARLVIENPDPTSGNFLEQAPKVLLLVFAFAYTAGGQGASAPALVVAFAAFVGLSGLLLHRWFFTWVPALPQPRLALSGALASATTKARRVILIVIDGCRADRLLEARTPNIDRLRSEGADFRAMSTVYPARTVTCFSSMLTGAGPGRHGMTSNFVPRLGVKCESVFDVLRESGKHGAIVGIAHLVDAFGERDVRPVTAVMDNDEIDGALVREAQRTLLDEDPDLLVLQLLTVDQTGHARGSYNDEYLAKIEETDATIGAFLEWCGKNGVLEDTAVIVTADHGQGIGIGGHGYMTPPEITIPCVLWGEGVTPRAADFEPRFITDFAATVCGLLDVRAPEASVGRHLLTERTPAMERPIVFVIPAHNEAASLPGVLEGIRATGIAPYQAVVVDDGSTDTTATVARAHGAAVIGHERNRGLGAALRTGLEVARSMDPKAVVYLDADGEYDPRDAPALLAPILAGEADYVLGTRSRVRAGGMTVSRRAANRAFSIAVSACAGRWVSDAQTGFRAFSPRAADVAEIIHDYNYAQVLTLDLLHKGMRMKQVPVSYRRRTGGRSFVRPEYLWRAPLGMAREMLRG